MIVSAMENCRVQQKNCICVCVASCGHHFSCTDLHYDTECGVSFQVSQVWMVGNETQRHTEFLGVLAGKRVEASILQEPLQALCDQGPVYWTRRANGKTSYNIGIVMV